ncbi:hypothetical protein, partial [Bradyrhizobium sp.]|uniref:hypothetical protein n=1 Tax=Bradyrhizobium sp. TaxID=376 RepID=UPI003C7C1E15
ALRIAKVDVNVGRQRKLSMIRKFLAPVPGQRFIQLARASIEDGTWRRQALGNETPEHWPGLCLDRKPNRWNKRLPDY